MVAPCRRHLSSFRTALIRPARKVQIEGQGRVKDIEELIQGNLKTCRLGAEDQTGGCAKHRTC